MSTTPEYGEELMIEERETEEVKEASHGRLPTWEERGEREVAELEEAETETRHTTFEDHEAHRPRAFCDHCGVVIKDHENARRTADGQWVHEICPLTHPGGASPTSVVELASESDIKSPR